MKQFENKVLFIKDEEMLKEVKELLDKTSVNIDLPTLFLTNDECDYLIYDIHFEDFFMFMKTDYDQEITLEQFKELLKQ